MNNGSDFARRRRIQGVILVALTFFVGVLAGSATERVLASRGKPVRPFAQMGELPRPFSRLDLTDEQRAEISGIFEEGRPLTDSVLQEMMPHLQAINDSIFARIRNVLTPDQAALLDESFERRGMGRGGMGPGGMDGRWRRTLLPDSAPGGRPIRPRPGG